MKQTSIIKKKFKECSNKTKYVWKYVYEILSQCKDTSPTQINYNSRSIHSPADLAEIFLSKVQRLKANIPGEYSQRPTERLTDWLIN